MASEQEIKAKVHATLRGQKVKLWQGEYVDSQGEPIVEALEHLAEDWSTDGVLVSMKGSAERTEILQALQDLQARALSKLKAEESIPLLEVKLLGWKGELGNIDPGGFASRVSVDNSNAKNNIIVTFENAISNKTGVELLECLSKLVRVNNPNMRLIYHGKSLDTNKELAHVFKTSMIAAKKITVLCLVYEVNSEERERIKAHNTIQARILAIRDAANQIRDSTKLEITNQTGETIPMAKDEKLAFLTALALHRLGLNSATKQEKLTLLLEADVEWSNHPNLNHWRNRVDNYGLLQLDIAWIYLQLESLSNLPDSLKRLEEAEKVLRKQVHVNFITLALAQAEMGNFKEVPPLAAIFAKLFLLQGIAYLCDSNISQNPDSDRKSQERLDQANLLLQGLRSLSPEDSVEQLLKVMPGRKASDAIAALRKSHGDIHTAAFIMASDEDKRQKRSEERRIQHKYGLCQNGRDPVNVTQLETLKPLLKGYESSEKANLELAVGLLRLADNDLQISLELYEKHEHNPSKVQKLVENLDERLVQEGLMGEDLLRKKKQAQKLHDEQAVDEVALVSLVSMGIDPSKAKIALEKSANDTEKAMLWLSMASESGDANDLHGSNSNHATLCDDSTKAKAETLIGQNESRGDSDSSATSQARNAERDAQALLHRELGTILEERDLEKEYLGSALDEEWQLVQKYRSSK
mmetsp:Transcript_19944/g.29976  ORF Transcript_19944/g.29976 Transcript_19944/m.29976 type:complete len:696 (-) Transcript_19944:1186-3273(-)